MKGKYAAKAALHQAVTTRDDEIATYQRNIARLTADLRTTKETLNAERQQHRRTERELLARLDTAAAPRIEALEMLVTKYRDTDLKRRAADREFKDIQRKGYLRVANHFVEHHGLTRLAAIEVASELLGIWSSDEALVTYDLQETPLADGVLQKLGTEGIKRVQQARGIR